MVFAPKPVLIATLLAATGAAAMAQTPPPPPAAAPGAPVVPAAGEAAPGARPAWRDPAAREKRMAEHHAKRLAELKAALKLTAAQEGAWNTFTAATQPPARGERPPMDREAFKNLTTPQRIDLMEQRSAEHQARMKQRGDATKAFYAQLSAEQQKVFDQRAMGYATEELWFTEWEQGGTPYDVPKNYEKFNPVNHVSDWKVPIFTPNCSRCLA